jgi:dCTP deaminase
MAEEHRMIEPFHMDQAAEGKISYGLSSYGYDLLLADDSKSLPRRHISESVPSRFHRNTIAITRVPAAISLLMAAS